MDINDYELDDLECIGDYGHVTVSQNVGLKYDYNDVIGIDLHKVNKNEIKKHLKDNPELLNEIISELRNDKINKIKNK